MPLVLTLSALSCSLLRLSAPGAETQCTPLPVLRLSAPSCSLVLALSAPGCSLLTLSTPPVLRLCAPSSSLVRGITRVAETALK